MKHLSIWLTVLLLGGVAPTASALDYGSNSALLAADSNAPALPGATHDATPGGALAVDANDGVESGETGENAAPGTPRTVRPAASPRASALPRVPGPSASSPPNGAATRESPAPATAWQSLLPGSIQ